MPIQLRHETHDDYFQVENLVREAFWNVYQPGCHEHLILHQYRELPDYVAELSYLLTLNDQIIGQIMYSKGQVTHRSQNTVVDHLIFGPVAIHPDFQGQGYGQQLIEYSLIKAQEAGHDYVIIFGAPTYYHRFGFVSAYYYGVYIQDQAADQAYDFVMIKDLSHSGKLSIKNGPWLYQDPQGYLVSQEAVDVFDQNFPPKEKLILPGQLT